MQEQRAIADAAVVPEAAPAAPATPRQRHDCEAATSPLCSPTFMGHRAPKDPVLREQFMKRRVRLQHFTWQLPWQGQRLW